MKEKRKIEMQELLALVKLVKESGLDADPRINALLNCVVADNYDIASYNLLLELIQPSFVEQALRENPFPPPSEAIDGEIRFGFAEDNQFVGFMPDELHVLIAGEPGTGKTTIANYFIAPQAMANGIKCWFFVKARDTEKLIRKSGKHIIVAVDFDEQIKFNLLQAPKNVSRHEWYANLWDMFIQAEAIYDGTKNFLIEQSYDLASEYEKFGVEPSLFELYDYIKSKDFPRGTRNINYAESALNRIGGMLKGPLRDALDCSSGCLEELANENVIFNIGGLPASQQVFLVNALTSWLFSYKENSKTDMRHFLIIDDAMLLFDANFEKRPDRGMPIINHHLAEVRKSKINMIVIGQYPSLMGQGIFGTSSTKIMFTLSDSRDTDRMLDSMGIKDKEQRQAARVLSKEERWMIVKFSSRYPNPFLARVPPLKNPQWIDEIEITKEEKKANNSRLAYLFQAIKPRRPYREEKKEDVVEDEIIKASKDMLRDIYSKPFIESTDRARDFRFSNEKAKRIYRYFEKETLAEEIWLNVKGRGAPSKFYSLTEKGCSFIGKNPKPEYSGGKGSKHVFIQYFLNDFLLKNNYKDVEIEKDIEGKKIDLFCVKDDKRIAVEICISTFKTEYINVIKDRASCDRIILICLDNNSKKKLNDELGSLKDSVEVYALHEFLKAF